MQLIDSHFFITYKLWIRFDKGSHTLTHIGFIKQ